jgi:hypothetical protein
MSRLSPQPVQPLKESILTESASLDQPDNNRRKTALALTMILACYACARAFETIPTPLPRTAIVAFDMLSAMAFALVDGARHYRLRGILAFTAICIIVGNLIENLGVATGKLWRVGDIALASALVSIFVMGGFAALAWARLARRPEAIG